MIGLSKHPRKSTRGREQRLSSVFCVFVSVYDCTSGRGSNGGYTQALSSLSLVCLSRAAKVRLLPDSGPGIVEPTLAYVAVNHRLPGSASYRDIDAFAS